MLNPDGLPYPPGSIPEIDYPADFQYTGPIDPGHDRDCLCGGTPDCDPYPDPLVSLVKVTPLPPDPEPPF
ncbi:hypothetical protein [Candidatus Frankia alpina]|uniref:hypothetical protein n=1 Tax=Candidatus Frankia alpina TaxID=2699483 RepID=UPI0013CF6F76|nr:hypothetical protein [Candidatus Frankia alpina]